MYGSGWLKQKAKLKTDTLREFTGSPVVKTPHATWPKKSQDPLPSVTIQKEINI